MLLDHKFAEGLITKTQWTQYVTMLKKWVTIDRKSFDIKVHELEKEEKNGEITHVEVVKKIKELEKVVKPEIKITKT